MEFLKALGIEGINPGTSTGRKHHESKNTISSFTPTDGKKIATVGVTTREQYDSVVEEAQKAFEVWREMPAPQRGEIVRQIGDKLREFKEPLGKLVTYEMGKIYQEGLGEVQEMIDICDFSVGQSRMLYGNTMHSERP
ncbi:MAG TPA: aldehyde dehydrogenase family protein, partial [Balneolaceae bacterium]|nr:aldehyde dehydrogenase family protein [Balneolaceae bacterium]